MTDAAKEITMKLDACLDVSSAEAFLQEVRESFAIHDSIIFDASAVERFTTPAAQIMLSAFTQAEKEGKICKLASASDVVMNVFNDFGLTQQIQKQVQ